MHIKKSTYTNTNGRSYRGNVEASDPRYSFHHAGRSNKVFISEAPIDTLSRICLNNDVHREHSYISLCGLGIQSIEHFIEQYPHINIFLICTDHDRAGIEGAERIGDFLFNKGYADVGIIDSKFKDDNEELMHIRGKSGKLAEGNPNYILRDNTIQQLKESITPSDTIVQHGDLTKVFANMYYGLNHNGQNNYKQLKDDFLKITNYALQLAHKYNYSDCIFTNQSKCYESLSDDYRSYQDKGNLKKRIENIKYTFRDVKLLNDKQISGNALGNAYQKVANESMKMIMECDRKLQQQMQMTNTEITIPSNENTKPKVSLTETKGNIFGLLGLATKTLETDGMIEQAKEMFERITTQAKNSTEAFTIILEYVQPMEQQLNVPEDLKSMEMKGY